MSSNIFLFQETIQSVSGLKEGQTQEVEMKRKEVWVEQALPKIVKKAIKQPKLTPQLFQPESLWKKQSQTIEKGVVN